MYWQEHLLVFSLPQVGLLLVLAALGLAVGAVPARRLAQLAGVQTQVI
jgi:hypothetical protein